MKRPKDSGRDGLSWLHGGRGRSEYRLVRDRTTIATLRFANAWGSLATGDADGSQWTFKRVGFFRPRMTVRAQGSDADLAVFEPGWGAGGVLRFSDGRILRWTGVSFWRLEWAFTRDDGSPLVSFSQRVMGRTGAPV